MTDGIILFGHGSRDPEWSAPFAELARLIAKRRPDTHVRTAYLEHTAPTLEAAVTKLVAEGVNEIAVAPIFLAPGGHVKHDLTRMLADLHARHPTVKLRALPTIGEAEAVLDAIAAWVAGEPR